MSILRNLLRGYYRGPRRQPPPGFLQIKKFFARKARMMERILKYQRQGRTHYRKYKKYLRILVEKFVYLACTANTLDMNIAVFSSSSLDLLRRRPPQQRPPQPAGPHSRGSPGGSGPEMPPNQQQQGPPPPRQNRYHLRARPPIGPSMPTGPQQYRGTPQNHPQQTITPHNDPNKQYPPAPSQSEASYTHQVRPNPSSLGRSERFHM